jgi:hypothetical protein
MDWPAFLEAHRIDYVTSGPNVRKGQLALKCPWCGDDDPSEHLSISLTKDAFGCWRNAKHAGRKPYSLVAALLGCSFSQARVIVAQYSTADPASFDEAITALGGAPGAVQQPFALPKGLPPDFKPIKPTGLTGRFWRYLENRGFDDVTALTQQYGLLCCQHGRWKDRVIIPLYQNGKLLGWTARAIQLVVNAPRYLSSSPAIKTTVFNEDILMKGGKVLYVTEGPFDAIKMDYYGLPSDMRATCLFGVNPTTDQIGILRSLSKRFDKVRILFDAEAFEPALLISDWLSAENVAIEGLPDGVKDPGNLSREQINSLNSRLTRG